MANRFETILPFLSPLQHLIVDDSITNIMVNGSERVFVEKHGLVSEVLGLSLNQKFLLFAVRGIAQSLGDDLSDSKPILNAMLPDGSRLAVVIPPSSLNGVALTLRKSNTRQFGLDDLIETGMLTPTLAKRLEEYVSARRNILVSGGSGTGKTSLLSVLANFISGDERILLVEDRPEIQINRTNLLRFEAKAVQNGLRPTTKRDLLEAALGHRPDRIVVGDIRGAEAFDLLALMSAGHSGILATIQADGALQALSRFMSCALRSGTNVPYRALKNSLGDSLNVIVQIQRKPGRRYISEIFEINSYDADADLFDYCAIYQRQEPPR